MKISSAISFTCEAGGSGVDIATGIVVGVAIGSGVGVGSGTFVGGGNGVTVGWAVGGDIAVGVPTTLSSLLESGNNRVMIIATIAMVVTAKRVSRSGLFN